MVDKLNEAEPSFGIPSGTYDAIQTSLSSPVNAWRLYHATQYFDQHESALRQLATTEGVLLAPAMDVIDRLGERVRVSLHRYVTARMKVRSRQALEGIKHEVVGQTLYGMQKLPSKLASGISLRPRHSDQTPSHLVEEVRTLIRPGDFLITHKEYALTNYFCPASGLTPLCIWAMPPHFSTGAFTSMGT